MARLHRPHCPLRTCCLVAAKQLKWHDPEMLLRLHRKNYRHLLDQLLADVAKAFGCQVKDLRRDHDPALALRTRTGEGKQTVYDPPANDPDFMVYRPHGAQFEGSHDVKTRIRGEHGQFSDVALIKRERRRTREPTAYQKRMADLRERQKALRKEERRRLAGKAGKKPKSRWPSRPFGSKKSPRRFGGS